MTLLRFTLGWAALFGFYVLFVGQLSADEFGLGTAAALATVVFVAGWYRIADRRLRMAAPWLRLAGSALIAVPSDSARVAGVLLRVLWRRPGPAGTLSRQDFFVGTQTPEDAGRRGLVTLAVSLAPNGFVVELLPEANALLVHQLAAAPARGDRLWRL